MEGIKGMDNGIILKYAYFLYVEHHEAESPAIYLQDLSKKKIRGAYSPDCAKFWLLNYAIEQR